MIGLLLFIFAIFFFFIPDKRYISVFLIFAMCTAGFQIIPFDWMVVPNLGITKPYDLGLYLCAFIFLVQPQIFLNGAIWVKHKNIIFFLIILIVLLAYSILYIKAEVSISIRVFRSYCFFIPVFLFATLNEEDIKKVLRLIVYFTSLASFIYCLQPVVGKVLINTVIGDDPVVLFDEAIPRYFNIPVFIFPVIFVFFFNKSLLNLKFYWALAFINLLVFILCQHRSLFMAVIFCFVLNLLLNKRVKIITLVVYIVLGLGVFLIADTLLAGRFSKGFKDVSEASFEVKDVKTIDYNDLPLLSTSEFRFYHFIERFLYVADDSKRMLFGIGLITEDSKLANQLSFTVGTTSEENETVPQIATGDIAWSVLILNFGIVGIVAFLAFYIGFFRNFIIAKKNNIIKMGLYYIICLFITSFYSTMILQPFNLCLLMLFVAYAYNYKASEVERKLQIT